MYANVAAVKTLVVNGKVGGPHPTTSTAMWCWWMLVIVPIGIVTSKGGCPLPALHGIGSLDGAFLSDCDISPRTESIRWAL